MATLRTSATLLLALALTACATPSTVNPRGTKEELSNENRAQLDGAEKSPIKFNEKKPYGHKQVAALQARLNPVTSRIARASAKLCAEMQRPAAECQYPVTLDTHTREMNAYADGTQVVLYPAMVDFTRNESELAAVVAHEFAHNLMQHPAAEKHNDTLSRLLGTAADVASNSTGIASHSHTFNHLARDQAQRIYSPEFEAEADYISLYLMARAGYSLDSVPEFWRRMSQANPEDIALAESHPSNAARTVAIGKAIDEIRAKQRAHQALIPNIRQNDA